MVVFGSPAGHSLPKHSASVPANVRYAPNSDRFWRPGEMSLSANSGLMHRSNLQHYSITSSAVICIINGTMRPSAFAVLRLMTSSNLVGCSTGRSAGLSPLRIRPT